MRTLTALPALLLLAACSTSEPPAETPPAPVTEVAPEPAAPEAEAGGNAADEGVKKLPSRVNLNTGSKEDFKTGVPGIGDKMVHEFEEYRPYVSIQQFRKEMSKYVDADTIAMYEQHVFVPVAYNDCDAQTMAQIYGLDLDEANAVIAQRPFADEEAFIQAVSAHIDESEVVWARAILAR